MSDFLRLVGRFLLAGIFLASAFGKVMDYAGTIETMEKAGVPMVKVALPAAIGVLALGSASVITGFMARFGAVLLLLFLGAATYFFHLDFPDEAVAFMKNLAIAGGLLTLIGTGPGGYAVGGGDSARR